MGINVKQAPLPVPSREQAELAEAFPEVAFSLEDKRLEGEFAKVGHHGCGGHIRIYHWGYSRSVNLYVSAEFEGPEQAQQIAEYLTAQLKAFVPGLKAIVYAKELAAMTNTAETNTAETNTVATDAQA